MHRRYLVALSLLLCLAAVIVGAAPALAQGPVEFPRNNMAPAGMDHMDATPEMVGPREVAIRQLAGVVGSAAATGASPVGMPAVVGEGIIVSVSDIGLSMDYDEGFVVVADGTHGIILVEQAAYDSFDGTYYHFPNPNGDGSEAWLRTEDLISQQQLEYLLDQFDRVIYPTNTSLFGQPLARGAEGQKVWILIHNIRDEAYYDSTQTSYVAGYFSASENAINNKNMMHIDSYDWLNRIGPDSARPFMYEGTFAHEFEHLIHFDQDPDEESWVDEGLANMAAYFCGYGHPAGHIAYYLVYHPVTALTYWGGGLESYGASYLFQLYLYEKYGGAAFSSALVQQPLNGIAGIQATLTAMGYDVTFDKIFDDWTIANYVDSTKHNPLYGYDTLEIGGEDTWGYSIEYALNNFWVGGPLEVPIGFDSANFYGDPLPYTAHYFRFAGKPRLATALDGDDSAGVPAYTGTYEFYSGMDTWAWRGLMRTFTIPATGATLDFMANYDIEEDWDYAYVEVYDQTTGQWYTLPDLNGHTVSHLNFAQDNPNTPNMQEPAAYAYFGCWNAFTGNSDGWVAVSMDLSPFAGHTIDLYFRSWQDGAASNRMIYVDDIRIDALGFSDGAEAGMDNWISTGWTITDGIIANDWQATLLNTLWAPSERYPEVDRSTATKVLDETRMVVDPVTQAGAITGIPATPLQSRRARVLIVSNRVEHILPSGYWVQFTN